jgi:ubiquitin carboxyl-terminal hydrolase L3
VFHIRQISGLGNACGTIAALHAIVNKRDSLQLSESSAIAAFATEAADMSPQERGEKLMRFEGIRSGHNEGTRQRG